MAVYAYDAMRDSVEGDDPRRNETLRVSRPDGRTVTANSIVELVQERRKQGKQHRRYREGIWQLCQRFVAGDQWVGLTKGREARVVEIANPRKRVQLTVNLLTQFFETGIGKLYDDNFMPNLQFARPDEEAQRFIEQCVRAFRFAWDEEIQADDRIHEMLIELLGYGTAAMRCRFDMSVGPYIGEVPVDSNGAMVPVDEQDPRYQETIARMERGESVEYRTMREGAITWDVLSPFNFLVPPGIPHPRLFPWVIVETPLPLGEAKAMFGERASALAEQDLSQVDLIGDRDVGGDSDGSAKLKDHCLLSTMYETPTGEFPNGRVVHVSQDTLLEEKPKLPYNVNGHPRAGIVFFRYHRVPRRFYGIGLIEPGIGPQRQRNIATSQNSEMKDKNLGRVYTHKGVLTEANMPVGRIMEHIEIKQSAGDLRAAIMETQGVPPGPWIAAEKEASDADMEKVMGFRDLVNSESMRGVTAYAAFALQAEQEDRRVGPILSHIRSGIVELSRFTTEAMRMYWPIDKQVILAGPDNVVDAYYFDASKIPAAAYFSYGKGQSGPRSPAAEIQKIFDIYDRSVASGQPLGMKWLMSSVDAFKAMPFPQGEADLQREKAELENLLAANGQPPMVSPLDDHLAHLPEHRVAWQQASLNGREDVAQILVQHILMHEQQMQSQQQLVTRVPGMQGGFGEQGGPQQMAANQGAGMPPSG